MNECYKLCYVELHYAIRTLMITRFYVGLEGSVSRFSELYTQIKLKLAVCVSHFGDILSDGFSTSPKAPPLNKSGKIGGRNCGLKSGMFIFHWFSAVI